MNKHGEILIIEDDLDDRELLTEVFISLKIPNPVRFFPNGEQALEYLTSLQAEPFIILSDINLPKLSGFELRERIFTNKELSSKCIPYIFFTTAASKEAVNNAYSFSAQGFFKKPDTYNDLEDTIKTIIDYWTKCYSPSDY